jgi:hypothetical protein
MDTSAYFGVECRGCENRIALVELSPDQGSTSGLSREFRRLRYAVESCGTSRTYRHRHVLFSRRLR